MKKRMTMRRTRRQMQRKRVVAQDAVGEDGEKERAGAKGQAKGVAAARARAEARRIRRNSVQSAFTSACRNSNHCMPGRKCHPEEAWGLEVRL